MPSQKSDKSARGPEGRLPVPLHHAASGTQFTIEAAAEPQAERHGLPPPVGEELRCSSPRPWKRTSRTAFADLPPEPDDPLLGFAPYIHRAPRRNSITPERQREFIAMLAATGIVTQAARHIGASLEALYRLRGQPGAEGFAAAWEAAIDRGMARLEDCALERAILGEERPIVRGGEVIGTWRWHNSALLMFLLRQRRNRRYRYHAGFYAPGDLPNPGDEDEDIDWTDFDKMVAEAHARLLAGIEDEAD